MLWLFKLDDDDDDFVSSTVRAAAACEADEDGIGSTRTCTGMDDVIGTGSDGAELSVTLLLSEFSGFINGEIVEDDDDGCVIILEESCSCY